MANLMQAMAVLAALIAAETAYRQPLYNLSDELIQSLQTNAYAPIWKPISDGSVILLALLPLAESLVLKPDRALSFFRTVQLMIVLTFMLTMKNGYKDPRPYWSFSQVEAWSCSKDFGNPSGHSMSAWGFAVSYAWDKPKLVKVSLVSAAITVSYSRLVLGAHGLNQVVYGSTLGLWIAVFTQTGLRTPVLTHVHKLPIGSRILAATFLTVSLIAAGAVQVFAEPKTLPVSMQINILNKCG